MNEPIQKNLADSLAALLPDARIVYPGTPAVGDILHMAIPKTFDLKQIDTEQLLPNPRRVNGAAKFADADSFLAYVNRYADSETTVAWCDFNPQTFHLSFAAVIDDHAKDLPGWRGHKAAFIPDLSAEWKAWKGKDREAMSQVTFAEWIQDHEADINSQREDMPTSIQMLKMATEFQAHEEHSLKSAVRLQSGGVRLQYIADDDNATVEEMKLYEKFALGLPVFHGCDAWAIVARLKYRNAGGRLSFFYELQRADKVHESAAKDLITKVREGLGAVPLFMGSYI